MNLIAVNESERKQNFLKLCENIHTILVYYLYEDCVWVFILEYVMNNSDRKEYRRCVDHVFRMSIMRSELLSNALHVCVVSLLLLFANDVCITVAIAVRYCTVQVHIMNKCKSTVKMIMMAVKRDFAMTQHA